MGRFYFFILSAFIFVNLANAGSDCKPPDYYNQYPAGSILRQIEEEALLNPNARRHDLPCIFLNQEIAEVIQTLPDVIVALSLEEDRTHDLAILYGELVPTVTFSTGFERTENPLGQANTGFKEEFTTRVETSYVVYSGFSWSNSLKAAKEQLKSAEQNSNQARNSAALLTATKFFMILRARLNYELALRHHLYKQEINERCDNISAAQDKKICQELTNAHAQTANRARLDYQAMHKAALYDYGNVQKHDMDNLFLDYPDTLGVPPTVEQAIANAFVDNPAIKSLREARDGTLFDVRAARGQYWPRLTGRAGYIDSTQDSNSFANYDRDGWYVGGVLSTDFNFHIKRSRVAKAQTKVTQAEAKIEAERRKIRAVLQTLYSDLESTSAQIEKQLASEASAIQTVGWSEQRLFTTSESIRNLLSDRDGLFQIQVGLNDLNFKKLLLEYQIHAQIGDLVDTVLK